MGTPAQTNNAHVVFDTKANTSKAFKQFVQFVKLANAGEIQDGEFDITKIKASGKSVTFEAYSGRVDNLEWQLSEIAKFFKIQKGVQLFSADVLVHSDGFYWEKNDERN